MTHFARNESQEMLVAYTAVSSVCEAKSQACNCLLILQLPLYLLWQSPELSQASSKRKGAVYDATLVTAKQP